MVCIDRYILEDAAAAEGGVGVGEVEEADFDSADDYGKAARGKGFLLVSATPLTRSSYHADRDFAALRSAREEKLRTATEQRPVRA